MSNTITLTLDQFTQAQSLNTVVSGLERMLVLLEQVDKYKELVNKATGKPQELLKITTELAKIEKQIIALQMAEEKLLKQREKTNQEASKSALIQQRLEEQKQKAAERAAQAKAKAEAAAQDATQRAAQAKVKAEEAAARAAARSTAEAQRLAEQQRKAAEAAKRDAERAAAAAQRLADQQNRAADQQRRAAEQQRRASDSAARAAEQAAIAEEKKKRQLAAQGGLLGKLQDQIRRLNQLKLQADTPEQIARINRMLDEQKNKLRELGNVGRESTNTFTDALGSFQFKFNFLGNLVADATQKAISSVKEGISQAVEARAKLSDEFADIQKTTGMTKDEVVALNDELQKIDTRTATSELRKIAAVAGQLGISKEQVFSFTKAVDTLVVALGDEFGGGAEQITKELGALRNIFGDIKTDAIDKDMLRIGNALNELGATGAATAPVVADFASRIGGVAIPMGLTSDQVLALSATLQELNVNAERGGTAVVKILQKMASNTKDFAKVAGMDVAEFSEMVNTDLYGAFIRVVEASGKSSESATLFAEQLQDMGVEGAGASEVIAKLGANTKLLESRLKLSNKALKETSSITGEFNTKNENFAAKVEKIGKAMTDTFVNSGFAKAIEEIVGWFYDLTKIPLSEKLEEEQVQLGVMQIKLNDVNISAEERVALVKQLQLQYPEYLGNLNAETVSNNQLNAALDKVNNNLINKIILQKKDEEVTAKADEAADAGLRKVKAQQKIMEGITQAKIKYNYQVKLGMSIEQQAGDVTEFLAKKYDEAAGDITDITASNAYAIETLKGKISSATLDYTSASNELNSATTETNILLAERNALEKELGLNITNNTAAVKGLSDAEKQAEADRKKQEQLAKELAAADENEKNRIRIIRNSRLREIAEANLARKKELQTAEEKGYDKSLIETYYNQKIADINAKYRKMQNDQNLRLIEEGREREIAAAELSMQEELAAANDLGMNKAAIAEYWNAQIAEINKRYDEKEIEDLITQGNKEQEQYIANKEKLAAEKQKQFEEERKRSQMIIDLKKEEDEIIAQMQQENLDREKRLMEERIEMTDQIVSNAIDGVSKRRDAEISAIEDQVSAQRDAVAQQRELANQGAANSLAAEEQRLAELERKKVEAQRRNERLQKVETYYNLLSSYAKDDPKTAPQKALVQMAIAEGIAAAFLEKGGIVGDATDTTTIGNLGLSKSHKDGNVLAVLSPNEGVLSAKQVQALGGEAGFYSLQRMLDNPHNDDFTKQAEPFTHIVSAPRIDITPVVQKLEAVEKAIKKIPGNSFAVDEFGNLIHTIVQDGKREVINKGKFVSPNRKRFL